MHEREFRTINLNTPKEKKLMQKNAQMQTRQM